MKLVEWRVLIDNGFSNTKWHALVRAEIESAIADVAWPPGSKSFAVNPLHRGNGVVPIKTHFTESLCMRGWLPEYARFDLYKPFPDGNPLPFVVEWETGNISSSHRAINRILLGMIELRISGGVLVLPSRALYKYLTDRVGNFAELQPYFALWESMSGAPGVQYLAVAAVEHDYLDDAVPLIRKGTDGRAVR